MTVDALVIATHPDDEVLGVGGMIARDSRRFHHKIVIAHVTGTPLRQHHAFAVGRILGASAVTFAGMTELQLTVPAVANWIKGQVEHFQPKMVYTHSLHDLHLDHRVVAEATVVACRPYDAKTISGVRAFTVDPFEISARKPHGFIELTDEDMEIKRQAMREYVTELREGLHPRSLETINTRARYFGALAAVQWAEPVEIVWSIL